MTSHFPNTGFVGRYSCLLVFSVLVGCVTAQPTNDSLAHRLIHVYQDTSTYSGVDTATFLPAVRYERVKKQYIRVVEVSVSRKLSSEVLIASDTLTLARYRAVRRKSSHALRGENIHPASTFMIPLTAILGSTVAVVSLFYWRS